MVGGPYLSRKELDPLGADVTEPPQPQLVLEPVFYNPKFDQMPLQIEGGPSDEYEQNNADWASLVTATIQAAQERDRAEKLWQSGKRSEAMAILHRNPNVGIEYRALVDGEVVRSGSYFGKDAADFLQGINIAVDNGLLSPVVARITETARNHHASMTGQQLKSEIYGEKIYTEVNDARGGSYLSECTKMALGGMGFGRFINLNDIRVHFGIPDSVTALAEAFGGITPKAITIGNDIYYGRRSDYNPSTVAGLAEMGHEVTHSIQFKILGASMYSSILASGRRTNSVMARA